MTTYENSLDSKKNHCLIAAEDHLENGVVATIICLAVGLLVFVQGGGPTGDPKKFAMGWFMMGMAATFGLGSGLITRR